MARRNVAEIVTGAVVLVVAAGFLAYAVAHTGRSGGSGYTLHANFDSIAGLNVGSDVRIAGVKVGAVSSTRIDPKTYRAQVSLTVADMIKLPRDSSAEVTSDGLLGGKYLALQPGGDEQTIPAGGQLTITQSSVNLEQLLGKFIFSAANLTNAKSGAGSGAPAPAGHPEGNP